MSSKRYLFQLKQSLFKFFLLGNPFFLIFIYVTYEFVLCSIFFNIFFDDYTSIPMYEFRDDEEIE